MKEFAYIRWLFLIALVLGFTQGVLAQIQIEADSTDLLIGDQVNVRLRAELQAGNTWINRDLSLPDTLSSVQVLEEQPPRESASGSRRFIQKEWRVAVFDTGYVWIPPLPVVVQSASGSLDTLFSRPFPMNVRGVELDSTGMAPIKSIYLEEIRFSDYLPLMIGALVIGLLAFGIWYYLRQRKRKAVVVTEYIDTRPPHQKALDALDALEKKKLWQQGQIKEFHSELSHIIRSYLEERYGIQALESTTDEILSQMQKLHVGEELIEQCRDMMQMGDMIKFAKAQPSVEVHALYLEFVRTFVIQTKPLPGQEELEEE